MEIIVGNHFDNITKLDYDGMLSNGNTWGRFFKSRPKLKEVSIKFDDINLPGPDDLTQLVRLFVNVDNGSFLKLFANCRELMSFDACRAEKRELLFFIAMQSRLEELTLYVDRFLIKNAGM